MDADEVATVDEAWKAVGVVEGGDATSLSNTWLPTDGPVATDNAVYDRSCRKVQNPQKGLYIKSGKKVDTEWWHFTLNDQPFPDTYFIFPVKQLKVGSIN